MTIIEESTKHPMITDGGIPRVARASSEKNTVIQALVMWIKCGIDGFYIKGIEHMHDDPLLVDNIKAWKTLIGPNKILMVANQLLKNVNPSIAEEIVKHVDLVDIFIDVTSGTKRIAEQIHHSLSGILEPGKSNAYIQWSIGGISELESPEQFTLTTKGALAATLMSLMLPGSPNVYHGDGSNEANSRKSFEQPIYFPGMSTETTRNVNNHGLNNQTTNQSDGYDTVAEMISLRDISPSIYKSIIRKKDKYESNTSAMYLEKDNILILQRWYPRRNTFASISNFGNETKSIDLTNHFYSGQIMIGGKLHEKIYFDRFEVGASQTIIVKIDK